MKKFILFQWMLLGLLIENWMAGNGLIQRVYTMVSVEKSSDNAGAPKGKKDKVIIFRFEDVDTDNYPSRDANGILISDDIDLLSGEHAIELYLTPGTMEITQTTEGEVDSKGTIQQAVLSHPGSALEIEEFLQNNINQNLGMIVQYCDSNNPVKLLGTPCAPLQIEAESTDNNEGDKSMITFKSVMRGYRIAHYEGVIPTLDTDSGSGSGA